MSKIKITYIDWIYQKKGKQVHSKDWTCISRDAEGCQPYEKALLFQTMFLGGGRGCSLVV